VLNAGAPTGDPAVAQALADLLDQVTQLVGVPGVVDVPVLGPLLSDLAAQRSTFPSPTADAFDGLVGTLRSTPGSGPALEAAGLGGGTGGSGPDGGTGAAGGAGTGSSATAGAAGVGGSPAVAVAPVPTPAKKAARATIRSISISKDRRRIRVRLGCPKTARAACVVTTTVTVRGAKVAKARKLTVKAGKSRWLTVKVPASRARAHRRAGGRVVVKAVTKGATAMPHTKSRTVRRVAR
jgi:hypothetical protein